MSVRNLIVLFDGTWDMAATGIDDDQSNVERLYRLLPDSSRANVHYEEGVGVKSEEEILGGMFGSGIDGRIFAAYRFLQRRYLETEYENRLFIFGFSRGAYTARTFAQLLDYCGVPTVEQGTRQAWDCYYRQDRAAAETLKTSGGFTPVQIEMLGVWDTVKSTLDRDRADTTLYPSVKSAYHAMSIDEKRRNFPVLRFDDDPRITQVWFAGVHSDIGGGYASAESGLADCTLAWMVEAARQHGMEFVPNVSEYVAPDPLGTLHNSLQGAWVALGESTRQIRALDSIHSSVRARIQGGRGYNPANLPANPRYV